MLIFLYQDDSISELLEPEVITACPSLIQFAPQIYRNGIATSHRDHTPCTGSGKEVCSKHIILLITLSHVTPHVKVLNSLQSSTTISQSISNRQLWQTSIMQLSILHQSFKHDCILWQLSLT